MDYSYLVQLDETTAPQWINALRVGNFKHPVYGDIDITPERLQRFAASVTEKIRGIDPDIDYDHKADGGKAAGWVKGAEVREDDALWLNVEWTDPAKEAIKNKEYRYFSAEIVDDWTDAKGVDHADVIFGGALTNRPFMKDLAPLNFDDYYEQRVQYYRDISTDELAKANADDFAGESRTLPIFMAEDVMSAVRSIGHTRGNPETIKSNIISITKRKGFTKMLPESWQTSLNEEVKVDTIKLAEILGVTEEDEVKLLAEVKSLREFKEAQTADAEQAKKFAEMFPEIHAQNEATTKRLAELEKTNKMAETDSRLKDWTSKGLPPVVEEVGIREFRSDLSPDAAVKFDEIIAKVVDVGLVKLNDERGSGMRDGNAIEAFEGVIQKIMSEGKDIEYFEAVTLAERAEPELAKAYKANT